MIKGKRGAYVNTQAFYKAGDWVMVNRNGKGQQVGQVSYGSTLSCSLVLYELDAYNTIVPYRVSAPITSIACKIPEDVAKNLLLLQGVEL